MSKKKSSGQVLDVWGTVMVLFTAALVIFAMVGVYFLGEILKKMEMQLEVENVITMPYTTGDVLSHHKINDREFLEHALEAAITRSAKSSPGLSTGIADVMKKMGFVKKSGEPKYSIIIKNNSNDFVNAGKSENEMDDELSNTAVIPLLYKDGTLGYVKIIIEGG